MTKTYPLVSILTPTHNRRLFIPQYLRYVRRQDYPGPIEVVIADDGDDPIDDLVRGDARIRYLRLERRTPLGFKRNLLARESRGEMIVHMDDDDYYPPQRVKHAVDSLLKTDRLIAGASEMAFYDPITDEVTVSGPFGLNHATAGTMAYRREYLRTHAFDDSVSGQEEPVFTDGFTAPMVQLNPRSTILVIRHARNTWDKSRTTLAPTELKLKDFVRDMDDRRFYRKRLPQLMGFATVPAAGAGQR